MKIEISIIFQIIRKPNPITVSFVIDFSLKISQNMLTSIDVKFPSSFACFSASSGEKGMISSADILQIVNIFCRVVRVFLLFLVVVRLFRLQFKTCEIFRHPCTALPKQRQPRSTPGLLSCCPLFSHLCFTYTDVIFHTSQNVFQIWSTLGGYEELALGFEPIRNRELYLER